MDSNARTLRLIYKTLTCVSNYLFYIFTWISNWDFYLICTKPRFLIPIPTCPPGVLHLSKWQIHFSNYLRPHILHLIHIYEALTICQRLSYVLEHSSEQNNWRFLLLYLHFSSNHRLKYMPFSFLLYPNPSANLGFSLQTLYIFQSLLLIPFLPL